LYNITAIQAIKHADLNTNAKRGLWFICCNASSPA